MPGPVGNVDEFLEGLPVSEETEINDYRLVLTCGACPEQYDVFKGEENVGYLRLRHGRFTADAPFGHTIYTAYPNGDGVFDDDERDRYLAEAVAAIDAELSPRQEDEG
jgi:hypothetical protein